MNPQLPAYETGRLTIALLRIEKKMPLVSEEGICQGLRRRNEILIYKLY